MKLKIVMLLFLVVMLTIGGAAYAFANDFNVVWWTVDGGGGTSRGGDYEISGTIGQPDVSELMSGGDYTVVGGFWDGALAPPSLNLVYFPLVVRY